ELGKRHCEELDLQRPSVLLGWSMGGVLAAEMSRVILARGGEVSYLGLLDSRAPHPEMRLRPIDHETLARAFVWHASMTREREPVPPASTALRDLLASLRALGADDFADEAEVEQRMKVFIGLIRMFFHHEQQPVPVKIHLFEATD